MTNTTKGKGTKGKMTTGLLAAGLLGAASLLAPTAASARGGSPTVGRAHLGTDDSCFSERTTAGIRNDCSTARNFVLPAIYDNAGGMTFHIAAVGVNGTALGVSCRALSVDRNGVNIRIGSLDDTVRHDGATEVLQSSVDAHGWGATIARCLLDPGTTLRSYHY